MQSEYIEMNQDILRDINEHIALLNQDYEEYMEGAADMEDEEPPTLAYYNTERIQSLAMRVLSTRYFDDVANLRLRLLNQWRLIRIQRQNMNMIISG
jgi:hypothetical protein